MTPLKIAYEELLKDKKINFDQCQRSLLDKLEEYLEVIDNENNSTCAKLLALIGFDKKNSSKSLGMYIWGGVGRGKSLMLNLFYDKLSIKAKKRAHFHEFMIATHNHLEELRRNPKIKDPVKHYAKWLARRYKVIILDELQVNNIADAMIVSRLFTILLNLKVFIFIASNRIPVDLFKDGLQRERFLPFIDTIRNKLEVFNLDNLIDYRLQSLKFKGTFFTPINPENEATVQKIIQELTGGSSLHEQIIKVQDNRTITAFHSYGHMAVFSFNELCEVALGVLDYLALCSQFNLVVIKNIKRLTPDHHNELLRFITLIDCLYEKKIKIICLSECSIDEIYEYGIHAFEFKRTISRLKEMNSKEYFASSISQYSDLLLEAS
ncbi:MAG: AFG1-like ATPase [Candidatus Midichloriaceae bacterium]|jgi:cell division protein ZapE|nr:AFG1-like ATPase [Candidatus Midichloriaceae bacterium]